MDKYLVLSEIGLILVMVIRGINGNSFGAYYGLRVSMSQSAYSQDLMASISTLFETAGPKFKFEDIVEEKGATLREGGKISNITTGDLQFTKGIAPSQMLWTGTYFNSSWDDAQLSLDIQFNWNFRLFGVHAAFGTGNATLTTTNILIGTNFGVHIFNYFPCWIRPTWTVSQLTLSGLHPKSQLLHYLQGLLLRGMTLDMDMLIGEKITIPLGLSILSSYELVLNKLQIPSGSTVELLLSNSLWRSYSVKDYLVLSFESNISISELAYNNRIWRWISTPVDTTRGEMEICINYEVIPGSVEVVGKSRIYYEVLNSRIGLLNPTIGTFSGIVEGLGDAYPADLPVNIGCGESSLHSIIQLVDNNYTEYIYTEDSPRFYLQIPIHCELATDDQYGETFLSLTIITRGYYYPKLFNGTSLYARLKHIYMYSYTYNAPYVLSYSNLALLNPILEQIVNLLNNQDVFTPGLSLPPTRGNAFKHSILRELDACFYYHLY